MPPGFEGPLAPINQRKAPVAQLDRAPDYGSGGLGFESLRVCFFNGLRREFAAESDFGRKALLVVKPWCNMRTAGFSYSTSNT